MSKQHRPVSASRPAPTREEIIRINVNSWRRNHGLPPTGVSRREFNLKFNSAAEAIQIRRSA